MLSRILTGFVLTSLLLAAFAGCDSGAGEREKRLFLNATYQGNTSDEDLQLTVEMQLEQQNTDLSGSATLSGTAVSGSGPLIVERDFDYASAPVSGTVRNSDVRLKVIPEGEFVQDTLFFNGTVSEGRSDISGTAKLRLRGDSYAAPLTVRRP